jgi:hypothetical protein
VLLYAVELANASSMPTRRPLRRMAYQWWEKSAVDEVGDSEWEAAAATAHGWLTIIWNAQRRLTADDRVP